MPEVSEIKVPELAQIDPKDIIVSERLRAVDEAWVEAIAASIEQKSQDTPIQVRRNGGGSLHLVAGAHRLEACRRLGVQVRAEIIECSALEARLIEIDENLFRRELGALDRAVFLAERKAVYEEMYPETRKGVAGGKARQGSATDIMSFAAETASRTDFTERTIRRAIQIATNIPADVRKRLIGTKIAENQSDLLYLADLAPATQRKATDPPPKKWSTVIIRKTEDLGCRISDRSQRKLSRNYGKLKFCRGKACPALMRSEKYA